MYYYSNRSRMSASPSAAWPGAGGQQSCCGGGAELRNGNGGGRGGGRGQITEARAFSGWESATCDSANAAQSTSTSTRDREDGAELELSRCCRGGDGRAAAADGQDGSVRLPRGTGTTRTAARGVQSAETAISERGACSYSAGLHCGGGSDPDSGTGTGSSDEAASQTRQSRSEPVTHRRRACVPCGASRAAVMEGTGGACNGKRRGCGTAKGRVRLCRVRSFLSYTEGERANGTGSPSVNGGACEGGTGDVTGSRLKQVEAMKRQVRLGERTDMLWRRLHAVQVKQVERHVTQQLVDMRRSPVTPNSAELLRLARSCSEALRTAGGALDSDHTASSSGGGSDSEEEEEGRRRGRHDVPSRVEWQWMWERAWLGSRWVWLQAQVSELEYGIRALTELYTHLRQGKCRVSDSTTDMPLGARRSCPGPQGCRKKLAENSPHTAHTASAARVRPLPGLLPGQHRPRLIRLNTCPALGLKVMSRCRCEPPAVCVLCGGPRPPVQDTPPWVCQEAPEQRNHPTLSMPSVFPHAACGVAPPLARLQSHNTAKWMDGQGRRRSGGVRRRRRILYPSPPGTLPSLSNSSGRSTCRGLRGVASAGLLPQQAADLPHLSGGVSDTQTQPMQRRRGQSSFDINNLVMPLGSVGLQARVQKLQYKQIITPSWRELDSAWEDSEKQMVTEGPHAPQELEAGGAEHSSRVEDLSDAVFLKRHAVWESRERNRWGNRWGSRARRRHRGRSSSRGLEETPSCPELRRRRSSAWCSFHYTADETFHQTLDEQQTVLTWERRSFPLLKEELHWLQDDEEAELEEDVCAASGRSQSTDSGISEGSLELSPRTPHYITYTQEATNQSPLLRTQTPPCFL